MHADSELRVVKSDGMGGWEMSAFELTGLDILEISTSIKI
jgi:hypothetical protein